MIYPEGTKSVYFATDASNLLNASGYRVSYIPNLVSVINTVTTLLFSFIGILCLIICFVIIKRYVENNRVNIGIMRANGITKGKIAASLLPFALIPSIVGGVGAYIVGLLLQAAALTLFKKYWMLPTPLIGFD
ncbi:MAG: FtsX-like permease family protein [Mycoplasmoidaceae bacterium]|nr:FtsX-like permease family protein [Mycoplasmoidaceae bacterium]